MNLFICKHLDDLCSQESKGKHILHNSLQDRSEVCVAALSRLWLGEVFDHASFLEKSTLQGARGTLLYAESSKKFCVRIFIVKPAKFISMHAGPLINRA